MNIFEVRRSALAHWISGKFTSGPRHSLGRSPAQDAARPQRTASRKAARSAALQMLLALWTCSAAVASPLPNDSLYQLDAQLTAHDARDSKLADRRGRPQLVAMFYTSCKFVCPLIIDSVKGVEHVLTPAERADIDFLLISIDPERDDVAALASVAGKRKLGTHWTLARTEERNVRKLAALLGVRYRALADGEFNHTSTLYLLDADGRKLASSSKLGTVPDAEFVAAVRAALSAK